MSTIKEVTNVDKEPIEQNTDKILKRVKKYLAEKEIECNGGVSDKKIESMEQELNLTLHEDVKEYLRYCGSINIGHVELGGLSKPKKHTHMLNMTLACRENDPKFPTNAVFVEMLSEDTVAIVNNVADMFEYSLLKRKKQSMNMKFEEYVLDRIKKGFKMKR